MKNDLELNIEKSCVIDDIYCKYYILDVSKPIVITFGPIGSQIKEGSGIGNNLNLSLS